MLILFLPCIPRLDNRQSSDRGKSRNQSPRNLTNWSTNESESKNLNKKRGKTQPHFLKRILIVCVKYFATYTFIFQTSIFFNFYQHYLTTCVLALARSLSLSFTFLTDMAEVFWHFQDRQKNVSWKVKMLTLSNIPKFSQKTFPTSNSFGILSKSE